MTYSNQVKSNRARMLQLIDLQRFVDSLWRFLLASDSIFLIERRLDCS
jgi:hypothetical protein